ncbi:hypothetical protein TNCV_535971 [Trichonephila clavipes]|nr:hypothetical protein TNCV_535971 [Trichonephila clavipes]
MTRTTPGLEPLPLLTFTPHQRENDCSLPDSPFSGLFYTAGLQRHYARTHDTPAPSLNIKKFTRLITPVGYRYRYKKQMCALDLKIPDSK